MTKQRIQIGAINSGSGDTLRAAMIKINNNFDELYDLQGQDSTGKAIDINGNTISSTFTNTDITISPNGTGNVVIDGDLVANIIKSDDSTGIVIDDNLILNIDYSVDLSSDLNDKIDLNEIQYIQDYQMNLKSYFRYCPSIISQLFFLHQLDFQ